MLLLGSSLVWWLSSPRGGNLTPPAEVVSLAGAPQSGEQGAGPHEELAVRTVDREYGQLAAYPPTPVDLIVSGTASPSPNERETISTEVPQEQAAIPSTALPSLQRTGEHLAWCKHNPSDLASSARSLERPNVPSKARGR